jgi:broad specificity phosphatase PhoE
VLNLLLTRHGMTTAGPSSVLGAEIDVPLAPEGREQAEALAKRLAGLRIDRVISSPMIRALETARIAGNGCPVETDVRLREMDYGHWEGLVAAEIDARDPELRARWEEDPAVTRPPGGETGNEVADRVREFLSDLLAVELSAAPAPEAAAVRRSPDPGGSREPISEAAAEAQGERRVLVVAHGSLNRILLCVALDSPVRDFRRRFVQDRANLTVLRYEPGDGPDGAQLVLDNDVSHLRGSGQVPWG